MGIKVRIKVDKASVFGAGEAETRHGHTVGDDLFTFGLSDYAYDDKNAPPADTPEPTTRRRRYSDY